MNTTIQGKSDTAVSCAGPARFFRVLVVDDNEADRRLAAMHLGAIWPFERDLEVDYAVNGGEALQKIRQQQFALIVLDWKMPRLGGGEVLRTIRQGGTRVPVVVLSGADREFIDDDIESLGASYLNKNQLTADSFLKAIAFSFQLLGQSRPF